jgi:hypothetical protein
MAKIIPLFDKKETDVVAEIEFLLSEAKAGKVKNFIFASFEAGEEEGIVLTAYANADLGTRQTLIGHLEVDVMYAVMKVNMDRLLEE